jgi:nucleoside 2-deoxyribosyltransferase
MPSIYAAGPSGFTAAGLTFHAAVVVPALRDAGCSVLDPWAPDPVAIAYAAAAGDALGPALHAVCARNVDLIDACDGVLAVLDGTDVDSGTAAEIGYAAALRRPVVGIRLDLRRTGDAGMTVNGQVEHFAVRSGGGVLSCPPDELADPRTFVDRAVAALLAAL